MEKEYSTDFLMDFGKNGDRLIPVVTQHFETNEVLILSFLNKEAFEETIRSNYATYYSRSRKQLWKKGETSGDYLRVVEIRVNCEQDSLLFKVIPEGKGVCHAKNRNGISYQTCYYRRLENGKLIFDK